jgi:hypothetical protein
MTARILALALLMASPVAAEPIMATLDGCVHVSDPRLATARWSAIGTFSTAAFRDDRAGCAPTIEQGMSGFDFDEDRLANTLTAWIRPSSLPICGRVQYDAQVWMDGVPVDGTLKALVVDSGVDCGPGLLPTPELPNVSEPWTLGLLAMGVYWNRRRNR